MLSLFFPPSDRPPNLLSFFPRGPSVDDDGFDLESPGFFVLNRFGIVGGFSSLLLFMPGLENEPTSGSSPTSFLKYSASSSSLVNSSSSSLSSSLLLLSSSP